jgi:triosephosphate isomerase
MKKMKYLFVANWKCNPPSLKEAEHLFKGVINKIKPSKNKEIVICPPFVYLLKLSEILKRKKKSFIKLGAQDCFYYEKGAYTGAISPLMLKDLGCEYVILGHSERREIFKENDEEINKKIILALKLKLKPILCIGEKDFEENEKGFSFKATKILKQQLMISLKGVPKNKVKDIVIAYEPVWAIGTGKNCSPLRVNFINLYIKKFIYNQFKKDIYKNLKILYGGSVNKDNALDYIKKAKTGGLLVGGASLRVDEFTNIVNSL